MLDFWVKIWSFSRGTEITNMTGKIPFWTLMKKIFTPWATSIQMMTLMSPTVHSVFLEVQKWSFYMFPIKILSWKMTNFTPFFSLLVWITYWWWILNPYEVYTPHQSCEKYWSKIAISSFCIPWKYHILTFRNRKNKKNLLSQFVLNRLQS